ncbi:MAG TPA: Mu transposase C-terminal domain-containing protein [Ktedonobacteraceae bacterium]|nr:Mu transposase C-terminal domain-containing protein [Ktedonobacteraceae bacterium]
MAKPLDGVALPAYFRRLGYERATQDLLIHIRNSPPSRTPGARRGNMPVWYPSKKMQCIIKAESAKVEFAFLLQAEHADDVLEVWDQPPSIPLEYEDRRGRMQRPMHTPDYFLFRTSGAEWVECKTSQELVKLAETRPNRYRLDERGVWHCPPGETHAAKYGLTYRVWASDQVNWAAQENALFLEDYYQDLERLVVPEVALMVLAQVVKDRPGILLSDLRAQTRVPADLINIAIARHDLYVDAATYRLSEPWHTPVFLTRQAARTFPLPKPQEGKGGGTSPFPVTPENFTAEGRALLEQASEADLATALFRNRVIHPGDYQDDEQAQTAARRAAVPDRTRQYWQQLYRIGEAHYGSGFLGLLPHYHNCGGLRQIKAEAIALIHQVLETHYDTTTRKPKRGAYGEYLKCSEEHHLNAVSQKTFYLEAKRHLGAYDQTVIREGTRAAYPFKDFVREQERTISRHGSYCWAMGHLDHTELNLVLCDSRTGEPLGKCWLTLLILSHPRRIASSYLTFDPPSYRSCMMALRLCVQRYGRLPTAITVDGGSEFASVYFEQLLALYRVRKHQRPAAEPRFGAPQERLFGSLQSEFLYHLLGNTQATQQPRLNTRATDPQRLAVWTLPALAERVQQWADEEYETIRHPALGMTPRRAYDLSMERDGQRSHREISYDEAFRMATLPTTRKGTAKVVPGVGVRMNHLDYWCEAMRDATIENTQVQVRFDPFDVSVGFVYIDGIWRQCFTPYDEFAGCSERELQLLASELRQNHRLQYGREQVEITQKQLADFRRENAAKEVILRQQRTDRETRSALKVLEGGKRTAASSDASLPADEPARPAISPAPLEKKPDKLLVFKRIRT